MMDEEGAKIADPSIEEHLKWVSGDRLLRKLSSGTSTSGPRVTPPMYHTKEASMVSRSTQTTVASESDTDTLEYTHRQQPLRQRLNEYVPSKRDRYATTQSSLQSAYNQPVGAQDLPLMTTLDKTDVHRPFFEDFDAPRFDEEYLQSEKPSDQRGVTKGQTDNIPGTYESISYGCNSCVVCLAVLIGVESADQLNKMKFEIFQEQVCQ